MKSAPLKSSKNKEHSSHDEKVEKRSKLEVEEEAKMLQAAAKARASKYNFDEDEDEEEDSFAVGEGSLEDQKKSLIKQKGKRLTDSLTDSLTKDAATMMSGIMMTKLYILSY